MNREKDIKIFINYSKNSISKSYMGILAKSDDCVYINNGYGILKLRDNHYNINESIKKMSVDWCENNLDNNNSDMIILKDLTFPTNDLKHLMYKNKNYSFNYQYVKKMLKIVGKNTKIYVNKNGQVMYFENEIGEKAMLLACRVY